jgi:hypothetical protein
VVVSGRLRRQKPAVGGDVDHFQLVACEVHLRMPAEVFTGHEQYVCIRQRGRRDDQLPPFGVGVLLGGYGRWDERRDERGAGESDQVQTFRHHAPSHLPLSAGAARWFMAGLGFREGARRSVLMEKVR